MKRWLPVLVWIAGLGSFISCKPPAPVALPKPTNSLGSSLQRKPTKSPQRIGKPSTEQNPFGRYLADAKANWPEPALVRFASECQVDLDASNPRYAQEPGEKWVLVKDLSRVQEDQETDFYHTLAVWHAGDRMVTEEWGMELDTGDYHRMLFCMDRRKVKLVDSVSWRIAVEGDGSSDTSWGYEHRWKLGPSGQFETTFRGFVDLREQPMSAPKLDEGTRKSLDEENVGMTTWADLKYPDELLQ
jgi:hypothetical protein